MVIHRLKTPVNPSDQAITLFVAVKSLELTLRSLLHRQNPPQQFQNPKCQEESSTFLLIGFDPPKGRQNVLPENQNLLAQMTYILFNFTLEPSTNPGL